jgi:hypothetical protein
LAGLFRQDAATASRLSAPLPDVPVGVVPPDLEPYWMQDEDRVMGELVAWLARRPGVTDEARAEWQHRARLLLASRRAAAAAEGQRRDAARLAASTCPACGDPESVKVRPMAAGNYLPVPGPALPVVGTVAVCEPCRPVLLYELAARLGGDTLPTGTTRSAGVAGFLEQLTRPAPAAPTGRRGRANTAPA